MSNGSRRIPALLSAMAFAASSLIATPALAQTRPPTHYPGGYVGEACSPWGGWPYDDFVECCYFPGYGYYLFYNTLGGWTICPGYQPREEPDDRVSE
jgi:hypothetical protein